MDLSCSRKYWIDFEAVGCSKLLGRYREPHAPPSDDRQMPHRRHPAQRLLLDAEGLFLGN